MADRRADAGTGATPELTVAFAPAKRDHGTEVTHQLVELGVDRIVPLRTERGVVRWDGERGAKQLDRLRRVAREAAMQCHRARIPEVARAGTPAELADRDRVSCSPIRAARRSAGRHFRTATRGSCSSVRKAASRPASSPRSARAHVVAIGPHVLRAVTAPAAVAAALAAFR